MQPSFSSKLKEETGVPFRMTDNLVIRWKKRDANLAAVQS